MIVLCLAGARAGSVLRDFHGGGNCRERRRRWLQWQRISCCRARKNGKHHAQSKHAPEDHVAHSSPPMGSKGSSGGGAGPCDLHSKLARLPVALICAPPRRECYSPAHERKLNLKNSSRRRMWSLPPPDKNKSFDFKEITRQPPARSTRDRRGLPAPSRGAQRSGKTARATAQH